jgi:heat shock protein HslJ
MFRLILAIPLALSACQKDESVSGFVNPDQEFQLVEIDGKPFSARATIQFPENGQVTGHGPCNRYGTEQSAPYPWLELGGIRATRMDCPDIGLESEYFKTLGTMSQIEALDDTLILRDETGGEMVFTAVQR